MFKVLVALMLVCQISYARELTVEQKISDLNQLVNHIKAGYGPLEYKKLHFGMDVDTFVAKYLPLIKESKSNAEFYYLIVKFVAEFNDSHFRANLPTTLETSLGFTTDLVQGKILVDDINRTILTQETFPFTKGDEVVSLDGKPINDELKELVSYMGQGFPLAAQRRAAFQITTRRASKVPAQKGKSVVEIRRGDSLVTEKVELEWIVKGKFTDEFIPQPQKSMKIESASVDYDKIEIEEKFRCSGESRIKIPSDATVIMKDPFVAYYYPTTKGNVGYLRIPHYSPTETNPTVDAKRLRFQQYEYAVSIIEKNTVGLVIDQDHNCGGSVDWLHKFLTLFMDKPFSPMQFELLASKASMLDFEKWLTDAFSFTLEYQQAVTVIDLIKKTWLDTNDYLTKKTPISGNEILYPNPVRYTKPIIVLIDELSGSGGDAFPALIKGYGRAKLLGTRTMGAGGHVVDLEPLNNSQIKVSITKSLFYRPDAVAVENNGAEPDVSYSPSINDFKYGYLEYKKFFTDELLKML